MLDVFAGCLGQQIDQLFARQSCGMGDENVKACAIASHPEWILLVAGPLAAFAFCLSGLGGLAHSIGLAALGWLVGG